ncbi:pyruvate, water dikinase regulatory protein [Xylocopilactobacillus apis]|uniref:Putative pyruvate, phosphate dikinase regulatory protein n=1 Tax=Xylocopilactobacillus apis TaxID=2932183 RepID=A0AAU9CZ50_9LACO|nr:pyruvate, water dikinase regulatory protein [Xylocopilactobacillus apis]BDR56518.1 putative pyruvate, phosphate dikinase regulatory protein [Xylocopilactobacillus apis]
MDKKLTVYAVSDSLGDTATKIARAIMAQFPSIEVSYIKFPFSNDEKKITKLVDEAADNNAIIIFSLGGKGLAKYMTSYTKARNVPSFDLMSPIIDFVKEKTGIEPSGEVGAVHRLNDNYFNRISAVEFAVLYDDGKDPKGFLEADLVLVGVSRTSKTPLSLFLANRNLKVANYPLVKNADVPKELFQIDSKKIVGLTTDPEVLNKFRRERLISYGLSPDATYSDMDNVKEELSYADDIFKKLNCIVINTAHRSIEETAALIMQHLNLDDEGQPIKNR